MTIDRTTTQAELNRLYLDNCGYEEVGGSSGAAMAKVFVTVCLAMLRRGIRAIEEGDTKYEFTPTILRDLIKDARRFAAANDTSSATGPRVTHFSFENFRA